MHFLFLSILNSNQYVVYNCVLCARLPMVHGHQLLVLCTKAIISIILEIIDAIVLSSGAKCMSEATMNCILVHICRCHVISYEIFNCIYLSGFGSTNRKFRIFYDDNKQHLNISSYFSNKPLVYNHGDALGTKPTYERFAK